MSLTKSLLEELEELKEAKSFHVKDELLGNITYEDLITTLQANEKVIDNKTATKTFEELLKAMVDDARFLFRKNMKSIIDQAKY